MGAELGKSIGECERLSNVCGGGGCFQKWGFEATKLVISQTHFA
jgi:hypothetical protein